MAMADPRFSQRSIACGCRSGTSKRRSSSTEIAWATRSSGAPRPAAGLRLPGSNGELVLQTERPEVETDLTVESVDAAVRRFVAAGGHLVRGPSDIPIGRCAVVADPFSNVLLCWT